MWSYSFSAQVRHDTRVLVVGSMPGQVSLAKSEYYAHPRNAFWLIMASLFGIDRSAPYHERLQQLQAGKVGLWDVYAECYREGSLDASIAGATAQCNDFGKLFAQYPSIQAVCFNGKTAEKTYKSKVLPSLANDACQYVCLPSTSPAHAGMSYAAKLEAWHIVKELAA